MPNSNQNKNKAQVLTRILAMTNRRYISAVEEKEREALEKIDIFNDGTK